jgi:transcriptional regulator with XRE-family HTH domain
MPPTVLTQQRPSPLRRLRLCLGLRLHDVERAVGIADTVVSRLERGEVGLNEPRLQRLAGFYGVAPEALARAMEAWSARHAARARERIDLSPAPSHDAADLEVEEPPEPAT